MMSDFGLWTRRLIAVAVVGYFGWQVYSGGQAPQDVKELTLIILGYYFGTKENV